MKKILMFVMLIMTTTFAHARDITHETTNIVTERSIMNPGDYVWTDRSYPIVPVHIIVNLTTQMAYVYSGDTLMGATNISSGREGFESPIGVFKILGKEDNHFSKKYKADMPWTMWLTNDGVALHSGGTPGRPSSHGCVHLPKEFAALLYQVVQRGTQVEITRDIPQDSLVLNLSTN